ncbi:TerD family protein [Actinomadura sp. WMMA1423]|uniref:TerD family protein n=1 Tax=Actinomadura sp. WMMA1423 TaxID=2591108 RepID=UPI0011471FFC|nr:TerD family protein [Actinomadura sp. WMMA1423]
MNISLEALVVRDTHRIPAPSGPPGEGAAVARQLDIALMSAGFKLSGDVLRALSGLSEQTVRSFAVRTLATVREMAGDHVRHNTYFRDFPRNVPDTLDFWLGLLHETLQDPRLAPAARETLRAGALDLLALKGYGRYQHTFEEMLEAQDALVTAASDRVTVLHLGRGLAKEAAELYLRLAQSTTPLGEEDLGTLAELAAHHASGPHPERIPVRENRAVINRVRLSLGADLLVDTVTDVLRLACALSDGDVTLQEPTRFASMPRPTRRALLAALHGVVRDDPGKLGDVAAWSERWKRLGERLHPHEYPKWAGAADVFAVARGEKKAPSFAARVEARLATGDVAGAARVAAGAPGLLFRSLDRLLRLAPDAQDAVLETAGWAVGGVSGRVLLSLREHLLNRGAETGRTRLFANRLGRGVTVPDSRPPLDPQVVEGLAAMLDEEIRGRLPSVGHLVVDPDVLDVVLPLSGKAAGKGLGVLPRGSVSPVDGRLLRFFVYWRQREKRTDFDLSALMLDEDYANPEWLSYTNLRTVAGQHSGDITDAPEGASEFINLTLAKVEARFIVPQVNIFSGEGFEEVEESFFGFMLRDGEQKGRPFEARTVRMKSELRGPGRVALPVVFLRGDDGRWRAKWLHLHLKGGANFNRVEDNRVTTSMLLRGIVERRFLTVRYLMDLLDAEKTTVWDGTAPGGPVTFIGMERPDGLHGDSTVYTPENLGDLVPA